MVQNGKLVLANWMVEPIKGEPTDQVGNGPDEQTPKPSVITCLELILVGACQQKTLKKPPFFGNGNHFQCRLNKAIISIGTTFHCTSRIDGYDISG